MGEAKRQGAKGRTDGERLPNFIFERDKTAEETGGFMLAGKLLTDISKHTKPSAGDQQLISELVGHLTRAAERDPHMDRASIWRSGVKPSDALVEGPAFDAAISVRLKRCIVVGVRVDPRNDGFLRLDDGLLADVMGRH
jgi:hypothetical protein